MQFLEGGDIMKWSAMMEMHVVRLFQYIMIDWLLEELNVFTGFCYDASTKTVGNQCRTSKSSHFRASRQGEFKEITTQFLGLIFWNLQFLHTSLSNSFHLSHYFFSNVLLHYSTDLYPRVETSWAVPPILRQDTMEGLAMALRPRLGRVFQCLVVGNLNYFIQIYIYIYYFFFWYIVCLN